MSIALLAGARLLVPVSSWFTRRFSRMASAFGRATPVSQLPSVAGRGDVDASPVRPAASRPVRILRVCDGTHGGGRAGRMVISGRMADVCAELDRLAAPAVAR